MTAPLLFITGASSGIGQAMALEWARRGGRLALVARRGDEMRAWAAAQGWSAERAAVYVADARDVAAMTAAGRDCIAAQGLPDVVIANAGISIGVDMSVEADLEVLRTVIETNNLGMAATFQPFIAPMRARRSGRLVGIASVAGIRGLPGHAAYSMSKAGVISFCESLRVECRPFGVRVVTIAPGYIDTPADARQFIFDAVPDAGRQIRSPGFGCDRRGCRPARDSMADGGAGAGAANTARLDIRPRAGGTSAQGSEIAVSAR